MHGGVGLGVQLGPSHMQMLHILPINNLHMLSIMISQILLSDSFSAATLNGVNTLTADLMCSSLLYTVQL